MVLPGTGSNFNAVANAGISDNIVQTTYDLYFRKALNSSPTMRNFVTVRPQDVPHPGTPVVMQKFNWFAESVVDGWKTPVSETAEVGLTKLPATSTFTLTPAEYAGATQTTAYLARRALTSFDGHVAAAMFDGAIKVIDEVIQDKIKAGVTEIIPGGSEAALTSGTGDVMSGDLLRQQFTRFEENNVPKHSGEFYAAAVHPRIIHDLRSEAGPNNWRVAKEYQNEGLLKLGGEIGEFEGFRFVSNNRVRQGEGSATGHEGGQAATYNSYFFGMDGLAEAEWQPLTMVESPQVDLARRFGGIAWKLDADWGVYEPLAVDVHITSSTLG